MPNIGGAGLQMIAITGWGYHPKTLASEKEADIVLNKPIDLFKIERIIMNLLTNPNEPRQTKT